MKFLAPVLALGLLASSAPAGPILPWRAQIERRLQDQQQLILQLIAGQRQAAPIVVPGPIYQLPIQGDPKQSLPIAGDSKQTLPIGGDPKQTLPPQGPPRQDLPVPGDPKQILPPAPPPMPQAYTLKLFALAKPVE